MRSLLKSSKQFNFESSDNIEFILVKNETVYDSNPVKTLYSVVIPAYNEEKRIVPFLSEIKSKVPENWEIIIVSDGNDGTADISRSVSAKFEVLECDHKLGKGGAILEGFEQANGQVVGYVDADGALGFDDVVKVFSKVNNDSPVAIASRWVKGSNIEARQTVLRILFGRTYRYLTFAILGIRQKDIQCGLKAYRKDALDEIMKGLILKNLSIDTAMLYHCKLLGFRVQEIPVSWRDIEGSKFRPFKTAFLMFITLIGLRLAHSKHAEILQDYLVVGNEFFSSL